VISSNDAREVDDSVLDRWDKSVMPAGSLFRDGAEAEADDPFDLEVDKPYALSIHSLYSTLGQKIPAAMSGWPKTMNRLPEPVFLSSSSPIARSGFMRAWGMFSRRSVEASSPASASKAKPQTTWGRAVLLGTPS
jgi:hypothetical protein